MMKNYIELFNQDPDYQVHEELNGRITIMKGEAVVFVHNEIDGTTTEASPHIAPSCTNLVYDVGVR